ncbi:MAG: nuclease [Acidobacteriia bacterium]|nr:nuclease [Terriglobia bacterium]
MSAASGKICRIFILMLAALFSPMTLAWGPDGHRFINRAALEHLPSTLPAFTKSDLSLVEYLANEPDRWDGLSLGPAQSPDHFIDLESVDFLKELPRGRFEYIRALEARRVELLAKGKTGEAEELLPERVGFQPYVTCEVYERLVVAFRQYRIAFDRQLPTLPAKKSALFYMGWLGHYVGDGANPLHTTVNYNGWVEPNANGFTVEQNTHFKFESQFVHDHLTAADFESKVHSPSVIRDVFKDYLDYLKNAHTLVFSLYQLEKEGAFNGEGTERGKQYVANRLAAGAQKLVDLWYSAWLASAEAPPRWARPQGRKRERGSGPPETGKPKAY